MLTGDITIYMDFKINTHCREAGFIRIPRKIMALKNLKAIIIDLNYIKGKLFFLDLTGE